MPIIELTLINSGRTEERFRFEDPDKSIRIGRTEDCDVQIDNPGISRSHCVIVRERGVYVLHDLDSNNGTFVNGSKVKVHYLNDGDVLSFDKYSIEFRTEAVRVPLPASIPSVEETDGVNTQVLDSISLARLQRGKASRVRGYLTLTEDPGGDDIVRLVKPYFVFGKDPRADMQLAGWSTPRVVALIIRDELGFTIIDVSSHGDAVRVNGKLRRTARLTHNDVIGLCGKTMRFQSGNSPTTSFSHDLRRRIRS